MDYRGPKSPQKNTGKENCCSFQMLLYQESLQKNLRERHGFTVQMGKTSGQLVNFLAFSLFLCLARCGSWQVLFG